MPRYRVDWTENRYAYVDADNEDDAIEKANDLDMDETSFAGADYFWVEEVQEKEAFVPKKEGDNATV